MDYSATEEKETTRISSYKHQCYTSQHYRGWLKIKYPSRHYAISPQPVARFLKFLKLLNPDTSPN